MSLALECKIFLGRCSSMNSEHPGIDVAIRYKDPYSLRKKLSVGSTTVEWHLLALQAHELQRMGTIDKLLIEDLMRTNPPCGS
jgi:hypothetical protein